MQTDNGNVVGNTLGGGDNANKKQSPEDIRAARLKRFGGGGMGVGGGNSDSETTTMGLLAMPCKLESAFQVLSLLRVQSI